MKQTFWKVFFSVGIYAALHSLLASRAAKQSAAQWFGERQRSGWYRVFFLAQSVLTMAGLLAYIARLPDRTLYHVRAPFAVLLRLGQVAGLAFATWAAWQVGLARILGLRSLSAWLRGDVHVPTEPEAQGPAPYADFWQDGSVESLRVRGPFLFSRHPLNLAPLPIFWLTPHLTVKRLAFNLAGTLYLVLGSLHEEARLSAAYGDPYRAYQHSGIRFY